MSDSNREIIVKNYSKIPGKEKIIIGLALFISFVLLASTVGTLIYINEKWKNNNQNEREHLLGDNKYNTRYIILGICVLQMVSFIMLTIVYSMYKSHKHVKETFILIVICQIFTALSFLAIVGQLIYWDYFILNNKKHLELFWVAIGLSLVPVLILLSYFTITFLSNLRTSKNENNGPANIHLENTDQQRPKSQLDLSPIQYPRQISRRYPRQISRQNEQSYYIHN